MTRRRLTCCSTLALLGVAAASLTACEIRVRDSAFRIARDVHRLCVVGDSDDESADDIFRNLISWRGETEGSLNLEFVRINADDQELEWRGLGLPSPPPRLPVTILVGRNNGTGESFLIDHWEAAPTSEELSAIIDSPVRRKLAVELARNIAVLIHASSEPQNESSIARELKSIVKAGIAGERLGLSMIELARGDPAEKLLCRFLGLRPGGPDFVCVAFGRGKLMTPPLVGDEITAGRIHGLVAEIRQICSCSRPIQTMGVDLPMIWSDAIDSQIVLMDDELILADLDKEVQAMLAVKPKVIEGDPQTVPIAPGRRARQSLPNAADTPEPGGRISLGFTLLGGFLITIMMAGWWFSSRVSK